MTGWLSRKIIDQLEHAGYIAVPKEQLECVEVTQLVDDLYQRHMFGRDDQDSLIRSLKRNMAVQMGQHLLEKGFIDVQIDSTAEDKGYGVVRHYARLHVLKPRTVQ